MVNPKGKTKGFGKYPIVKVGIFELRQYNSLLQKEVEWLADLNKKKLKAILPIFELTQKISQDLNVSSEEALSKVTEIAMNPQLKEEDTATMIRYLAEIQEIEANTVSEESLNREAVSVFLGARVTHKWLEENKEELLDIFNINVEKSRDLEGFLSWLPEFTSLLPQDILEEVIKFYLSEKSSNTEQDVTSKEEVLENLPK